MWERVVGLVVAVAAGLGVLGPGASVAVTSAPPPQAVQTAEQPVAPTYSQGVARAGHGWVFSGTDGLWRTDDTLAVQVAVTPAIPDTWKAQGFNHIGDIDVTGRYVYAPLEQPDYSKGQQATARYDAKTLRFGDAVVLPQHENSFVTVDPKTQIAYSMDHFDGDALLRYDIAKRWKPLKALKMSTIVQHVQGADVAAGAVWLSTSDDHNGLYRVDLRTGRVDAIGSMGHPGGEGEGIDATALHSGLLHTVTVDPSLTVVWFDHFRVTKPRTR